jgi:hypothetical protein
MDETLASIHRVNSDVALLCLRWLVMIWRLVRFFGWGRVLGRPGPGPGRVPAGRVRRISARHPTTSARGRSADAWWVLRTTTRSGLAEQDGRTDT